MDFPCADNSCMVFTVLLLIMAVSWVNAEQHFTQTTALSGVGQFYPGAIIHRRLYRLIPLIEYGAKGHYVLISPEEGELSIVPDSPEWFAWLASLSSFRFVGQAGSFSARRGYNQRPNRCWYAQRGIHQKNYSKYLGVSEHLTTARLEQVAAQFQSYLTLR